MSLIAVISPGLAACGGDETSTTQSTTVTDSARARPTALRERFERQMRTALEREGGDVDVDCAIERLGETLSNGDVELALKAIRREEEIPAEVVDASFEAGRACAAD